jgi:hypothetical protein
MVEKTEKVGRPHLNEPTEAEARQREADREALERAPQARRRLGGQVAPGYVYVAHPDHGEPVVFVPGELLPDWAADALDAGRAEAGWDLSLRTLRARHSPDRPEGRRVVSKDAAA